MSILFSFQLIVGILAFPHLTSPTHAEQAVAPPPHASTTITASARYEIVQSELAAKWMFRLDRVCGQVSQLVKTESGFNTWITMRIVNLPKCVWEGGAQYQIFSSSLASELTLLMHLKTGTTWQLVMVQDETLGDYPAWTPLAE
ncbi:MAG: hypothetical protein O2999_14975 [Nitrospirae bacterium]|nr:hypothetical protein [Nitrospirota bacterium]MDA1305563.1 hypothetical protein [Nitrospirota bacterium]